MAVYLHLVWGTWDRLPLLNGELAHDMYRAIGAECVAMKSEIIALGGIEDHVHLLTSLPATISVADLVKRLKGSSAHLATHQLVPGEFFKWQGGYGAVTVSPRHLDQVSNYTSPTNATITPPMPLSPTWRSMPPSDPSPRRRTSWPAGP